MPFAGVAASRLHGASAITPLATDASPPHDHTMPHQDRGSATQMPYASQVLIGIDIGTTSVKAVMSTQNGETLAAYAAPYPTQRSLPGMAEQDPATWLTHVNAALSRFVAHPRARDVAGIGVTSQVNTHVFCDARMVPLAPALTWQDTRPGRIARALEARLSHDEKVKALGAPIPIDASHALARMAWMAENTPTLWAATRHVLLPKDWVIAQLTGAVGADPLSAIGLAGNDLNYAQAMLALIPRAAKVLPPLRDPLSVAGEVRDGPFKGIPVATGTMDALAAMMGLGVTAEGQAMYLSGTSEVLGLISTIRTGEPGVVVFPDWRGITVHAGPTQSGGAAREWIARMLGIDHARLETLAAQTQIAANSPLFLPHLDGERAPLWTATSRAAFAGLSGASGPGEVVAAVLEGVAFSARLALEAVERSAAHLAPVLRHGGGGSRCDAWCQIRANALGRPIARVAVADAGAMGALAMGGVASGNFPDLAAATQNLVPVEKVFEPDQGFTSFAETRFAQFRELYAATAPISAALMGEI